MATPRNAPPVAGFGNCPKCAYVQSGPSAVCYRCARQTMEAVSKHRCMTCDHDLPKGEERCGNPLCNDPPEWRGWQMVWAIAMKTGTLDRVVKAHKYQGKWGWSWIFGRVLVGYLQANQATFRDFDMIIPSPTYIPPEGGYDHTGEIIRRAEQEDPSWPFRTDVMAKTHATRRLADVRGFRQRAQVAETEIADALEVLKPEGVEGASVLVFDDVFTGGLTLREIARKLLAAGADEVFGIVLARARYRGAR